MDNRQKLYMLADISSAVSNQNEPLYADLGSPAAKGSYRILFAEYRLLIPSDSTTLLFFQVAWSERTMCIWKDGELAMPCLCAFPHSK